MLTDLQSPFPDSLTSSLELPGRQGAVTCTLQAHYPASISGYTALWTLAQGSLETTPPCHPPDRRLLSSLQPGAQAGSMRAAVGEAGKSAAAAADGVCPGQGDLILPA